jgi:hypothetical protein
MTVRPTQLLGAAFTMISLCVAGSARAATIENFEIINSTSLSTAGGQFNGGETYSGSFSLDVDPTSADVFDLGIASFDIFFAGPVNAELSPAIGAFGFYSNFPATGSPGLPVSLTQAEIFFQGIFSPPDGSTAQQIALTLDLIQPQGATFHGGLVLSARLVDFADKTPVIDAFDASGSALIVDPAVLAPEPGSAWFAAGGIGLLWIAQRIRRKEV